MVIALVIALAVEALIFMCITGALSNIAYSKGYEDARNLIPGEKAGDEKDAL